MSTPKNHFVPAVRASSTSGEHNRLSMMLSYLDSPPDSPNSERSFLPHETSSAVELEHGNADAAKGSSDRSSTLSPAPEEENVAPAETPKERKKRYKKMKTLAQLLDVEGEGDAWKAVQLGYASWVVNVVESTLR